jgi:hypothetical protein
MRSTTSVCISINHRDCREKENRSPHFSFAASPGGAGVGSVIALVPEGVPVSVSLWETRVAQKGDGYKQTAGLFEEPGRWEFVLVDFLEALL